MLSSYYYARLKKEIQPNGTSKNHVLHGVFSDYFSSFKKPWNVIKFTAKLIRSYG